MKKKKTKHPQYTAILNDTTYTVRAKTPEKAAMKLYRINKNEYASLGYVTLTSEDNTTYIFPVANWCSSSDPSKFKSKPK